MDRIYFESNISKIEDYHVLSIYINGQNLIDIIKNIELQFVEQDLAGAYEGIPSIYGLPPSQHFYGSPKSDYKHQFRTAILESNSTGIPNEWTLSCGIDANTKTIIWHEFRQVHRPEWHYDLKYQFDITQYTDALNQAKRDTS